MYRLKVVEVELRLPGCRSLKEQRQRFGGLKDRVGKQLGFAVVQQAGGSQLERAKWTFAVLASDAQQLQKSLSVLEKTVLSCVDGEVLHWEEFEC